MSRYVFAIRHSSIADLQDDAAGMELPDDAAAREVAARVTSGLVRQQEDNWAGWTMEGLAGRPPGMAPSVRPDRAAQSSLRWSAARRESLLRPGPRALRTPRELERRPRKYM
jgi:hypothetical protein